VGESELRWTAAEPPGEPARLPTDAAIRSRPRPFTFGGARVAFARGRDGPCVLGRAPLRGRALPDARHGPPVKALRAVGDIAWAGAL